MVERGGLRRQSVSHKGLFVTLCGFSIGEPADGYCILLPKAAKPVLAYQLTPLPCIVVCVKCQFSHKGLCWEMGEISGHISSKPFLKILPKAGRDN